MRYVIHNDTTKALGFHLVSNTDHVSPVTGANPTVLLSKNFSNFVSAIGTVSEVGYGWYKLAPDVSDVNTLGSLILRASAPGADNVDMEFQVVGYDQYNGMNLGLSRLDSVVSNVYKLVWDEQRGLHTISGTFGATEEWKNAASVVILPIYAYLPKLG